jgi:hypothetical protein
MLHPIGNDWFYHPAIKALINRYISLILQKKLHKMITINGNFDVASHSKINLVWINDLLKDLTSCNLYVTLVARAENTETNVRKYKSDIFLWLVLPYADILAADDTKAIIIDTLLQELHRLERYQDLLDVAALRREIETRFGVEMGV